MGRSDPQSRSRSEESRCPLELRYRTDTTTLAQSFRCRGTGSVREPGVVSPGCPKRGDRKVWMYLDTCTSVVSLNPVVFDMSTLGELYTYRR